MGFRRFILRYILGVAVVATFAYLWVTLQSANSGIAWVVFLPAFFVLYVMGEWAFAPFLTEETGRNISRARFSVIRIAMALALMLPVFVVMVITGWTAKGTL